MINNEALEKIKILQKKYAENWGIDVDYTVIPVGLSQEMLVEVLERIVDTGESILVGYDKIKNKQTRHLSADK